MTERPPTNPRKNRQQLDRQLLAAFLILLITVGGGLIWWRYGVRAAATGLICALSLFAIIALLWAVLILFERIAEKQYRDVQRRHK